VTFRRLDRRVRVPSFYATDPYGFGRDSTIRFFVPGQVDVVSARIAAVQHELVLGWRESGDPSARVLGDLFGFSKQTWSRTVLGQRFAGETLLAALVTANAALTWSGPPTDRPGR